MADVVVKLFMSVFVNFAFRAHPDRGRLIQFLADRRLFTTAGFR